MTSFQNSSACSADGATLVVDQLAGPLGYGPLWFWMFVALTAIPVTWWAVRRIIPAVIRWANPQSRTDILRARSLKLIAGIEQQHADGRITSREANVELSLAVRQFVTTATGTAVDAMTLAEIEVAGDQQSGAHLDRSKLLVDAVRVFYQGAFDSRPGADLSVASRVAREVVSTWT